MRRTASVVLALSLLVLGGPAQADEPKACIFDVNRGICDVSGTISGDEPAAQPIAQPRFVPPPIRYLRVTAEGCYVWTNAPPGIDAWDPANENLVYATVIGNPECVSEPLPDRAWQIFRSFPLTEPDPTLTPEDGGITGLPAVLESPNPATITHTETLPSGQVFEVRALVATLTVEWGDGYISADTPTNPLAHTYTTKTCPPDYRTNHPSGRLCHPTLEAYPVTATYTWWGEYSIGGTWIPIGTLDLATTVAYDVDEVIGVLVDP